MVEKRTVEIAVNVTGANAESIGKIGDSFKKLGEIVKGVSTVITNLKNDFEKIKSPKSLDNFTKELSKLKDVKIANLSQVADGFERLAKIGTPPNLSKFADEVKKFNNTKFDNFKKIAEGFEILSGKTVDAEKAGDRLNVLRRNLQKFKDIKIPGLSSFVQSLEKLNAATFSVGDISKKLRVLQRNLNEFKGLSVPTLKPFIESLKKLLDASFSANEISKKLRVLQKSLKGFKGLSVPTLKPFIESLKELNNATFSVGDISKKLRVLQRNLQKFKGFSVPTLKPFIESLKELTTAGISVSSAVSKFTALKNSLKGFKGLSVPTLKPFIESLKELSKTGLKVAPIIGKLTLLKDTLKGFTGISVPSLRPFVNSLKELSVMKINMIIKRLLSLNNTIHKFSVSGQFNSFKVFANDLRAISSVLSKTSASLKRASASMGSFSKSTKIAEISFSGFLSRLSTYGQYLMASSVLQPIQQGIQEGIRAIGEYDQALKDLQAITNATNLQVAQMGDKILEVAETTKFSASEIAEGMRIIGQAGFGSGEAISIMSDVANLSTGTLSDMSTSVDLVTTALRVFNLDAIRSKEVSDVFANAVNKSKLTLDKLKTAMQYVGPVAYAANVSFKDLATVMGVLANSGLQASQIGTGIRRVLAELVSPSKKLRKAAAEAGVTLDSLNPKTNSLQDVLYNLKIVLADSGDAFKVFGKRGAAAALALTKDIDNYSKMNDSLSESGSAIRMAETQMKGLAVSFKNLKDRAGNLAIALGEAGVTRIFKTLIDVLRGFVQGLNFLVNNGFVQAAAKLAIFTTVVIGATRAFTALKTVIVSSTLYQQFALLTSVATSFSSFLTGFIHLLGGPVVLAVGAAVTALIGLVYWLDKSRKDAENNAKEMAKMADDYEQAAKKIDHYRVSTSTMSEDSKEHLEANKALRQELKELVEQYPDLKSVVDAALLSINPLTGELHDNGDAIREYQKVLSELEMEKIVESARASEIALEKGSNLWSRMKDNFAAGVTGSDAVDGAARKLFKTIEDGTVKLYGLQERLQQFEGETALTRQLTFFREHVASLTKELDSMYDKLLQSGEINMQSTVDDVILLGERMGLTGQEVDYLIDKMNRMQEGGMENLSSVVSKWTKEINKWKEAGSEFQEIGPTEALIKKYQQEMNIMKDGESKLFSQTQIEKAKLYDAEKANIIKLLNLEEDRYHKSAKAAGTNLQEQERIARDHGLKLAEIEKLKNELVRKMAEDSDYQDVLRILEAAKRRDEELMKLEASFVKTEEGYRRHGKRQAEIVSNYENEIEKIKEKKVDPSKILTVLKTEVQALKAAEQEKLREAEAAYVLGKTKKLDYEIKKAEIQEEYGQKRVSIAKKYEQQLVDEGQTHLKEYGKIRTIRLNEEIAHGKNLNKNADAINKERLSIEKKHIDNIVDVYKDKMGILSGEVSAVSDSLTKSFKSLLKDGIVDTSILDNLGTTVRSVFEQIEVDSSEILGRIGEKLGDAFDTPENKDRILALGDSFKESAEIAISAYEEVENRINAALESISNQQQKLISKMQKVSETQTSSELETADLRSKLRQATLDGVAKMTDAISNANKKLAKSDELYAKAMKASGVEREKSLEQSYDIARSTKSTINELASIAQKGHEAEKSRREELEAWSKKENKTDSARESHLKKLQKYNEDILKGKRAEAAAQKLINAMDEKKTRALDQLNKDYQTMSEKLEAARVSLQALSKEADSMISKFQEAIKIDFETEGAEEKLKGFMDALKIGPVFDDVQKQLSEFEKKYSGMWGNGEKAATESNKKIKKSIKSDIVDEIALVDGVWTNVWTTAKDDAVDAVEAANKALGELKDFNTNVAITGSGSETLPISEKIAQIKKKLNEMVDVDLSIMIAVIGMDVLDKARSKIEDLLSYDGKTIELTTINKTKTVEQHRSGGMAGIHRFARGGRLPGWGGGDKIRALLEAGEFIIRKEAVAKYGAAFFTKLNNMQLNLPNLSNVGSVVMAKIGGLIPDMPNITIPNVATSTPNMNFDMSDFGKLDLSIGNSSFPVIAKSNIVEDLKTAINRERLLRSN